MHDRCDESITRVLVVESTHLDIYLRPLCRFLTNMKCYCSFTTSFVFLLLNLSLTSILSPALASSLISKEPILDTSAFSLDESGNLKHNYLVYPSGKCEEAVEAAWHEVAGEMRTPMKVTGDLEDKFFSNPRSQQAMSSGDGNCPMICLNMGMPSTYMFKSPEYLIYSGKRDSIKFKAYNNAADDYEKSEDFNAPFSMTDWLNDACQRVESGWVNYHTDDILMNWIKFDGTKVPLGVLERGEKKTIWQTTSLGHRFILEDKSTGEVLYDERILHEGFKVIGDSGTGVGKNNTDPTIEIKRTLDAEWDRAHRVKRTFTELGFAVGRVTDDLWASIVTYYNANEMNFHNEEWMKKGGVHVNWWEVDAYMIGIPWRLKRYWQSRLMKLVESWSGTKLENTDIYGMRRYEHGARLLTHVDREQTHAASMIINIAQSGIRQPWAIEIYDFAGRLHEIEMEPGDIVYYESARCLHGRMMPLNGSYYVNLFTHYRPVGDPDWFRKENPAGTPQQLIDVGECRVEEDGKSTSCAKQNLETLSPQLESLYGPLDLFKYWEKTAEKQHSEILENVKLKVSEYSTRHSEL